MKKENSTTNKNQVIDDEFIENFWNKVDIKSEDECWPWNAHLNEDGYGQVRFAGNMKIASRIAYIIMNGNISSETKVMHSCDNRKCCNPKHLFSGTQKDNIHDMENKGRSYHPKTRKKMKEEEILKIRKMWSLGIQAKEIAKELDITPDTVYKIRMGRTYKKFGGYVDPYTIRGKNDE